MKFDEIHLRGLKFSITVNDNGNIVNIQQHRYIIAVYLISFIQRGSVTDTAFCDACLAFRQSFTVFTAQCTLVHMRGLGIACRPSVRLSVCDVGGL